MAQPDDDEICTDVAEVGEQRHSSHQDGTLEQVGQLGGKMERVGEVERDVQRQAHGRLQDKGIHTVLEVGVVGMVQVHVQVEAVKVVLRWLEEAQRVEAVRRPYGMGRHALRHMLGPSEHPLPVLHYLIL